MKWFASSVFWKASIVCSPSFCMERACGSVRVCKKCRGPPLRSPDALSGIPRWWRKAVFMDLNPQRGADYPRFGLRRHRIQSRCSGAKLSVFKRQTRHRHNFAFEQDKRATMKRRSTLMNRGICHFFTLLRRFYTHETWYATALLLRRRRR